MYLSTTILLIFDLLDVFLELLGKAGLLQGEDYLDQIKRVIGFYEPIINQSLLFEYELTVKFIKSLQ
jgi:hypothetical protein